MRRTVGLLATCLLSTLAIAGCSGGGNPSLFGPQPTPTPVAPSVTLEIALPTANSGPTAVTRGPDGFLWLTEQGASKVVKVAGTASVTEFATITPKAGPSSIVTGPDLGLWVTYSTADKIARLTASSGGYTEFPLSAGTHPQQIISASSPAGSNLWFTEFGTNRIGVMTTTGILLSEFIIPTPNVGPMSIIQAPDGNIWFTELNTSSIAKMTTGGALLNEYPTVTPNAKPQTLVLGPDGALWFVEAGPQKLGRITLAGMVSEVSVAPATSVSGLVVGTDNKFYFGDPAGNQIGQLNITGGTAVKEFPIPTANAMPNFLELGFDGKVYFSEFNGNKLGQFTYF